MDLVTLNETLAAVWRHLAAGIEQPDHPFRTPVFCTQGAEAPNARTLVLRGVDRLDDSLICFSDTRARKWAEVTANPRVMWVFYDPGDKVQLRASGVTEQLTEGERVDLHWASQSGGARNNYRTQAGPGQLLDAPGDGIPAALRDRESEIGREHFGVLSTRLSGLDWLDLSGTEHRRALFTREDRDWQGRWIAP